MFEKKKDMNQNLQRLHDTIRNKDNIEKEKLILYKTHIK